jgi:hypothetical protein
VFDGQVEKSAESFDINVHHPPLVHDRRVSDGGLVKNSVEGKEFFQAMNVAGQISGGDVAPERSEIAPISAGEIVGDNDLVAAGGKTGSEMTSDKSGAAGDQNPQSNLPNESSVNRIVRAVKANDLNCSFILVIGPRLANRVCANGATACRGQPIGKSVPPQFDKIIVPLK